MKAFILSIGQELTLGETVDTNSAWLSKQLAAVGVDVIAHATVADARDSIRHPMIDACNHADLLLVTGGLGPTEDDLTRWALADVLGVKLERHEPSVEHLRDFFAQRNRDMPEANLIQAMFPAGTTPIENTCGTAPGIRARYNDTDIFIMPGVPREMRVMYERDIAPAITSRTHGAVTLGKILWCYGAGESDIGMKIADLMQRDRNPKVGTTAQQTIIGIRIHAHGTSRPLAEQLLLATATDIRERLGDLIFGEDDDTLASAVTNLLLKHHKTVSTAESCTGGWIAKSLTDTSGSSGCFVQGFITYANEAKQRLLNIPETMLAQYGAVSAQVAEAMANACRQQSQTDYAISVTGIAGPTGGTPDKPVGLVYIGLADAQGCEVTEHRLGDHLTRDEVRDRTRKKALDRLRHKLIQL